MRALASTLAAGVIGLLADPWAHGSQTRPAVSAPRDAAAPAGSAEWVARQVQDRDTGRDARFEMRMRLHDRHGRQRERALVLLSLRAQKEDGKAGGETAKKFTEARRGDRLLIRFTYPNDIRGTAFLVWEHPAADDERFLYLPALGRVRRIAGSESQESFVGSDFTYEDIGGREFDEYTYAMVDENASWTSPDGASHPSYRLESRARDRHASSPRVVSLVRKDNFVVVHADIHNRRGEREKVYDVRRLERVEGIWTSLEMQMANELDRTRTELSVTKADYHVGLKESDFSRRELERTR